MYYSPTGQQVETACQELQVQGKLNLAYQQLISQKFMQLRNSTSTVFYCLSVNSHVGSKLVHNWSYAVVQSFMKLVVIV